MIRVVRNPSSKLRVLVITSTYPRYEGDYAVPWLRESVNRLVGRGHEVAVLAPSFEGLRSHAIDGVPVHRFRYSPARFEHLTHEQGAPYRLRNPWYQLLGVPYVLMGLRAAVRLARQTPFDVIHAHWPFPHGPLAMAAARVCGAPVVLTSHGAEFALARRRAWIRPILRRTLRRADLLLANSTWTAREIMELSGRRAAVLPFGSTVRAADSGNGAGKLNGAAPRVLFTGRLIQRKGVEYLLRAIPLVLARRPAQFFITGDGDERERLEHLAQALGIENNVRFLGFVSNGDLDAQYSKCDVWVNPAIVDDHGDTEGLGVGAIEAYVHRKPVVASDVGGIPDAVRHGETGLLVPEKDAGRLADAILELLADPARAAAMAEAGLRFARQAFDWDSLTDRLEQMYFGLLARRPRADRPRPTVLRRLRRLTFSRRKMARMQTDTGRALCERRTVAADGWDES